jgi:hypothetical protein
MKLSLFPCSLKTEIHNVWFQIDFYALIVQIFESPFLWLPLLLPLLQNATWDDYVQSFFVFISST